MFTFPVGLLKKDTPPSTDPFYNNVSLLLLANGEEGSTTFIDSGPANRTVSIHSENPVITTAVSKFGGGSLTGGRISVPYDSAFDFGVGDFTIELWFRYEGTLLNEFRFTLGSTNSYLSFGSRVSGMRQIGLVLEGLSWDTEVLWTPEPAGVWAHLAVSRSNGTVRLFQNGTLLGSNNSSRDWSMNNNPFIVSASNITDIDIAYIDDLRVTKGVARYTAAFTPPTSQLPTM